MTGADMRWEKAMSFAVLLLGWLVSAGACYWMNAESDSSDYQAVALSLFLVWMALFIFHVYWCDSRLQKGAFFVSLVGFLVLPTKYLLMLLPYAFQ